MTRRVLLVAEHLRRGRPDGITTYIRGLAAGLGALRAAGVDDVDDVDDVDGAEDGSLGETEITVHASRRVRRGADPLTVLGLPTMLSPLPGRLLTRLWDRGLSSVPSGFDVVHGSALAFPPSRGAALAVMVHDLAWRHVPEAFPQRGRQWHERALTRALHEAAVLLTPSAATADDLRESTPRRAPIEIVEHGADHLPAPDAAAATTLLRSIGVDGDYLLTVGTLEPRKNLERLFAAYALVRPQLPELWPLVVVGAHGWGDAVAPVGGVVLAGAVTGGALHALYAGARCFAYVPLLEGFGLPPLEAMRAGTAVVASDVPSVGDAALTVDPLDIESIADGLLRAATEDAVRTDLLARGREHAGRRTWRSCAARHLAVWSALAGS